ncbi:transporter substrate-binding domain-containing protein [uncultured Desulfosarcina sp.]|uniref:substrate-binding periplasmic protein n=1 Tax=uncultured Desulfosarcina sp. TaxID=218289 RepID=UPI0029C875F3|nr:transporter substrate-binding domain-containing protein [uncultured Desulfosarcina sp.]
MGKIKAACFVGILFFSTIPFADSVHADQLLVMAFNDTTSKPWKWKDNGKYIGPFIDVIQEVADRSGIKVMLVPLPWKRALKMIEEGTIDGSFGGYKTPEREAFAVFLDTPLSWAVLSIFVRKGEEFSFQKIEDLYGKRIGIVRGYTTSEEFDHAMKEGMIPVSESGNYGSLVKMLDGKRIEAIAGVTSTLQAHFADMNLTERFVRLPHPITAPKPIYICVSKKSKIFNREKTIAKMNQAMKDMEQENVFEKISQKYGYNKCIIFGCILK